MTDAERTGAETTGTVIAGRSAEGGSAYRVLARKYRPSTFDELIGQDAMVRTVTNAFETGRIPQAWILTGVRGVGKTTTARILARALNYELADGSVTGPTVTMPTLGLHCAAIMESRHFDVLEMDAASHNGVDDVRQIVDAIRYAPVSARYKVYILDEVHMVSTQGFNALLKTLEEPPPHAKFIFATTEIRKVPITVLSRCQRFDLRRLDTDVLIAHLGGIATREGVTAEPDALAAIARCAEGSVRDALSLFDRAIAHAGASRTVDAASVREMLGLADRGRVIDLFEAVMRGDIAAALAELRDQYDSGADPTSVLEDLAEFTHFVTRVKVVPAVAEDRALSQGERTRGRALATALSMRVLSQTWQMLLKGIAEAEASGKPIAAAEMVLVRIAYAADLPAPEDAIRSLARTDDTTPAGRMAPSPALDRPAPRSLDRPALERRDAPPTERGAAVGQGSVPSAHAVPSRQISTPNRDAVPLLARFEDLVALAGEKRDLQLRTMLERDVRLVRFEDGQLDISLEPTASKALVADLGRRLGDLTGRRWMVVVSTAQGRETIQAERAAREAERERGVRADPLVQQVLARFPGAEIVEIRARDVDVLATEPVPEDEASAFDGEHEIGDDDI